MSGDRAPDAIEPIRAWRVWLALVEPNGNLMLGSLTEAARGTRWAPGEALEASCPTGAHAAPRGECSCGIYAHKSWTAASEHARGVARAVVGEVQLWGRVVEHERGYRAQFAQPRVLWVPVEFASQPPAIQDVADSLSRRTALDVYGIPVGLYNQRTGLALNCAEMRRMFIPEPRPPMPLRVELPRIAWRGIRYAVITSAVYIAMIAGALAGVGVFVLGMSLPLAVGSAVFSLIGPGPLGIALGIASATGVVVAYARLAYRFELIERAR